MGGNEIVILGHNFKPFLWDKQIDNRIDVRVNFQDFEPDKNGLRLKANITSSTRATVIAPPCPEGFNQSVIEISLNDQQYSDNNVIYRYYRRPTLYYITPREGPIKGGTVVTAVGQNFGDTKEITCKFGDQKVPGVFKSQREIECIAPQTDKPMSVPFSISLSMDMYSPSVLIETKSRLSF